MAATSSAREQNIVEWWKKNSRVATFVGVGVIAAIAGVFLYMRSAQIRSARAEDAFGQAQQLLYSGKVDEGEAALMSAARRYSGTTAGTVAAMRLAGRKLETRKYGEAISVIREFMAKAESDLYGASFHGLLAAAWADSGVYDNAAGEFDQAAALARFEATKLDYQYKAAEMYALAGNKERALQLLEQITGGPLSETSGKARKLIGELRATPAAPAAGGRG
jgi:predicted negative regulator of RcsB-dependent stress response